MLRCIYDMLSWALNGFYVPWGNETVSVRKHGHDLYHLTIKLHGDVCYAE